MSYRKKTPGLDIAMAVLTPSNGRTPSKRMLGVETPTRAEARAQRGLSEQQLLQVFANAPTKEPEKKGQPPINRKVKRAWGLRASNKAGFRRRNKSHTTQKAG